MERVEVTRILGVADSCGLIVSTHVNEVLATCASSLLCTSSAEGTWLSDKAIRTVALEAMTMIPRLRLESDGVAYQPGRPSISAWLRTVKPFQPGFHSKASCDGQSGRRCQRLVDSPPIRAAITTT